MSYANDETTDLWSQRAWLDTPSNPAESPTWEVRTPWGSLSREELGDVPGPVIFAVVAVITVALGLLVSWRGEAYESAAGFWPPAGTALAALLMVPLRKWGWVVAAITVPTLIGAATGAAPLGTLAWWLVANMTEPLFSASVILWFVWSGRATRFRLFVAFWTVAVVLGPAIGATIGSVGTIIEYGEPWFDVWIHWLITDGLGVLIVAPMIITLTPHKAVRATKPVSEAVVVALVVLTVCALAFVDIGDDGATLLPYLMLVGLVWAGFRFGMRAVATAGFVLATAANLAIATEMGPFAESSSATARLTLPIFLMMAMGTAFMVALMAGDLAGRDEVEQLLTYRATHDPLTGLPKHGLFAGRLDRVLDSESLEDRSLAVLVIDLDDFRRINDRHGHPAGDAVLVEVADRLERALPAGSMLGRLGGDEFVAVVPNGAAAGGAGGAGGALDAHQAARDCVAALSPSMEVSAGYLYEMSCRIGVAVVEPTDPGTATELLRHADIALDRAKRRDERISFFDAELESETHRRVEIAEEFHGAVERGEISVVYQPLVSLHTGRITEFEALARWDNRRFGPVPPDEFVVIAERTGLIGAFGDFVLDAVCRQLVEWRRDVPGAEDLRVAVNVSARQLCDLALPGRVAAILDATSLPAEALTLEITETAIMDDLETTARVLRQLRALGLRLAMDDFGTGYSSMTNLRLVELDMLKIDRSFVDGLGGVAEDTAIVRSIINLGHSFGLTVVAEGVETDEQARDLMVLGCDHGQGYLWSRPVAPVDAAELIDTRQRLPEAAPTEVR